MFLLSIGCICETAVLTSPLVPDYIEPEAKRGREKIHACQKVSWAVRPGLDMRELDFLLELLNAVVFQDYSVVISHFP